MGQMTLVVGNKNYSSWSMRVWLLMRQQCIEFDEVQIPLRQPDSLERKLAYSPAGKVPILIDGDAGALARSVSAEMHSGFASLRSCMPLNCRAHRPGAGRGPGVQEDIDRICEIWRECRARSEAAGEFLFGEFTAADAMFAPVASRFQTYGVELGRVEGEYARTILELPAVRNWVEDARKEPWSIERFDRA